MDVGDRVVHRYRDDIRRLGTLGLHTVDHLNEAVTELVDNLLGVQDPCGTLPHTEIITRTPCVLDEPVVHEHL